MFYVILKLYFANSALISLLQTNNPFSGLGLHRAYVPAIRGRMT